MKISIVSPSYNQAAYLKKTLESVAHQDFSDYEHLVFDPGSNDGSREILEGYRDSNPRASVVFEEDEGQVDAINKGLARSNGEILTWLNTDDAYYDDSVLRTVHQFFLENEDVDIAYGRGLRVDHAGNTIKEAFVHPAGTNFLKTLETSIGLLQPSLFFRRRVYECAGGLDDCWPLQLDYELWIRFAQNGFRFGRIDQLLSVATVHMDAKSTKQRLEQLDECMTLIKCKFGHVPKVWVERFVEFFLTRKDAKVTSDIEMPASLSNLRSRMAQRLVRTLNQKAGEMVGGASAVLVGGHPSSGHGSVLERVVVTSFDAAYFNQGINLIASLHRTSFDEIDRIIVYPLGLGETEKLQLLELDKVELAEYPAEITKETFPEFLEPKSRAYKSYAMRAAADLVSKEALILWMDAGLSALTSVAEIFDLISEHDFFITNHDDSRHWPIVNAPFIHPDALEAINPSSAELVAPHYCSALVGYRKGGKFRNIIDEAWALGKKRSAVYWPKVVEKSNRTRLSAEDEQLRKELVAGNRQASQYPVQRVFGVFAHSGHRTQSILSILTTRYGAPSFSSSLYRRGNEASSAAAVRNWKESAHLTDQQASISALEGVDAEVRIYHHRGTFHFLDGLRFDRGTDALFIMGNGPSLKGFDFDKLRAQHTLGMNAAYRYWDEIDFYPTYYACFDTVVQDSHREAIQRLIKERCANGIRRFFLRNSILEHMPELKNHPHVHFLEDLQDQSEFFVDDKITTGSFSALVGIFLGYRQLFLLGIDLKYIEQIREASVDGRELVIDETPEENPNYFFDNYQVAGDRYNPPNRHPDMHVRSWEMLKADLRRFPVSITNLNSMSALRCFPFADVDNVLEAMENPCRQGARTVEPMRQAFLEARYWREELLGRIYSDAPLIGSYERAHKAHIDETRVVARVFDHIGEGTSMIDVGAHHGSALLPFLKRSWTVQAFEPDRNNRSKLLERLKDHRHRELLKIDDRCVGAESVDHRPFYTSEESTGISSLSSFHPSHKESDQVGVVSLRDFLEDQTIEKVDFLKIDTEGHDLFVLKGFPWERLQPRVIECEFEDSKTEPLGYKFKDLAWYLADKGYALYVSEWHPIERYGIRHNWHTLKRFPCSLNNKNGWGNILAFRGSVDEKLVVSCFEEQLVVGNPEGALGDSQPSKKPPPGAFLKANRHFRDGDYERALSTYVALYRFNPLSIYEMNALWAAKKLRLGHVHSMGDLE
ncbi:MAG: FkbM family methyltransferase [Pseudomonadota bacterium]